MAAARDRWFVVRQIGIAVGAAFAYFFVRGLTEGDVETADRNARFLLDLERQIAIDIEVWMQDLVQSLPGMTTIMNWVYIWLHWPVLIATLAWLLRHDRADYLRLRNAMMVSGAIGLVVFATFPVTPPRLLDANYFDTVTEYSYSYRVLQPPMFMDRYAAFPSLHFGWNLLAGIAWARRARRPVGRWLAVAMPVAMGLAVVATANHWVVDVVGGAVFALVGQMASDWWARRQLTTAPVGVPPASTLLWWEPRVGQERTGARDTDQRVADRDNQSAAHDGGGERGTVPNGTVVGEPVQGH